MNEFEFNMLLSSIGSNPHSLEKIFGFYYPKIIYHIGKKYGKDLAEDVAQAFFGGLLVKESFVHVKFPTTWVYINCESIAKRILQKDLRYTGLNENAFSQDRELLKEEMYGDLYDVIKTLNETEQKLIDMCYWEGYSLKEIANELNLTYDSARKIHSRLLKKIKNSL